MTTADHELVARALLIVLRAAVSTVPEFAGYVMDLSSWRGLSNEQMILELAAQPTPSRWIAVNWTGMLAVGSWPLPESIDDRLRSKDVQGLRQTFLEGAGDRTPTIFIRGGDNIIVATTDHAIRFQQLYSLPLCGRRVCDVRRHELRSALRDQYGAQDSDYVLEYNRLRDGSGGMHEIPLRSQRL